MKKTKYSQSIPEVDVLLLIQSSHKRIDKSLSPFRRVKEFFKILNDELEKEIFEEDINNP